MELFISTGDVPMSVHTVTLKNGHTPMIKDFSPTLSDTGPGYSSPQIIEPAVWFKVMVVSSVSIDCKKREITWNIDHSQAWQGSIGARGRSAQRRNRRRVAQSMYIGGELYNYDTDLDELFDTLQVAVIDFASSKTSRDEFNSEVMRILHCHVLPLIKLTTEDVPKMKKIYADQEKCIKEIDEAIMEKDKQMDSIGKAMQSKRSVLLSSFVNMDVYDRSKLTDAAQSCSKELSQALVEDCDIDMCELDQRLNALQREVDEVKKMLDAHEGMCRTRQCGPMQGSSMPDKREILVKRLQEKRDERNECHGKLNEVLSARENLREYLSEAEGQEGKQSSKSFLKYFKTSPQLQPLLIHNVYMGMRDTLMGTREKVKDLVGQKVLVLSVKEALRATLEELEVEEESVGLDISVTDGSHSTNVVRMSRKPQKWKSLRENVSDLLTDHSNEVCLKHNSFVKNVADCCQAAIFANRNKTELFMNSDITVRAEKECRSETIKSSESQTKIACVEMRSHKINTDTNSEPPVQRNDKSAEDDFEIVQSDGENLCLDPLMQAIDQLKWQIQRHFSEICEMIQTSLDTHTQIAAKMTLQCYEHHFYRVTHQHIMELYNTAFNSDTNRLQLVSHLTLKDIGMDNSVIMSMLHQKPIPESSQSESDGTLTTNKVPSSFLGTLSTESVEDTKEPQPTATTEAMGGLHFVDDHYSLAETSSHVRQLRRQTPCTDTLENLEKKLEAMQLHNQESDKKAKITRKKRFGSNRRKLFVTNDITVNVKNTAIAYRDVRLRAEFQDRFCGARQYMKQTVEGVTPVSKLQSLMRCLREVTNCWSEWQQLQYNKEADACCTSDDATDMLIILLLNCDVALTASLYPHIQFLADMLPPHYAGGQYDFCLTQFLCTYQFLQDRLVLKYGSYIK